MNVPVTHVQMVEHVRIWLTATIASVLWVITTHFAKMVFPIFRKQIGALCYCYCSDILSIRSVLALFKKSMNVKVRPVLMVVPAWTKLDSIIASVPQDTITPIAKMVLRICQLRNDV